MLSADCQLHQSSGPVVVETDKRNSALDGARFLAAVAVLWIHAGESPASQKLVAVCRSAVPFFTCSLVALGVTSLVRHNGGWMTFAVKRVKRLYVPFLCWSLAYLLMRLFKHEVFLTGDAVRLSWATLLTGTASHLWFLPFALLASLLICPFGILCQGRSWGWIFPGGLVAAIAVMVACTPCPMQVDAVARPATYFFGMSWAALPAALFGIALAPLPALISRKAAGCLGVAGLLLLIVSPVHFDVPSYYQTLIHNLGGVVLWLLAQTPMSISVSARLSELGALSFGIYLIHLGWVEGAQAVFTRFGIEPSVVRDVIVAACSLAGSMVCVALGRRISWVRPMF